MSKREPFTVEQREAMRVVEAMIHQGKVVLAPDSARQGQLMFMRRVHLRRPSKVATLSGFEKIIQRLVSLGRMSPNEARADMRRYQEVTATTSPKRGATVSKTIEIVVSGPVGSGKSHVLALIERALRAEYSRDVCIVSPDLDAERRLGSPGTKPDAHHVAFHLREGNPSHAPALAQAEAFASLDPLEQAIDQSVRLVGESAGALAERLSRHLDSLLDMQIRRLEPVAAEHFRIKRAAV
ncbi:hypothetical protein [Pseudomonas entomophila]|uniref:hypothetical protein n=1 Tax=Pseudomonas entomophila TaxID=312306 RepID=UPI003EBA170C